MIERAGIACPLVTGGSTGTYRFDSENPGMTELQPGSFVFMDMEYGTDRRTRRLRIPRLQERADGRDHGRVAAAGIRHRRWRLQGVLDRSAVHAAAGRHRRRDLWVGGRRARPARPVERVARRCKVGDRVEFMPPHIDPTVNLYDQHLCAPRRPRRSGVADRRARQEPVGDPISDVGFQIVTTRARSAPSTARCASTRSSRALYSTDASVYQIEPLGVVIPRSARGRGARRRTSPPGTACRSRRAAAARRRPGSRSAPGSCSTPRST